MLIVHVVAPGEFGGLERVVQVLGRGLRALGHEVHVLAVVADAPAAQPFLTPLADAGVHTRTLVLPGRAYRQERAAVAALCRDLHPDVVHTHGYRPDVIDAGVARRLGIPVVTTVHGFTGGGWRNVMYEWLQCRAFRRFDAVVAVSRSLVLRLERAGVPRARIHEVQNAWRPIAPPMDRLAARRSLGLPSQGFVVGWVGRLSYEKGPDVLLQALRHLGDVPVAASVIGDGVMRASLEPRAAGLPVRWHGAIPDAGRLLPAFDVCVLSSRTEGTPIVLFEAMDAGVPVVATCVGGVPDVVSPAEAALVRPDDPAALAAEIRGVYETPAVAQGRARAARARVDRDFGVAPWLDRYEGIYRQVRRGTPVAVLA
jgi:glycosyltransferase involved in cell wall biosynthesis